MGTRDQRTDDYIARARDFARPILEYLREVVHEACPEVEETWKWSFPHFQYKGMLCSMAAFKEHCAFGFWKAELVLADLGESDRSAMGDFGRLTSVKDLPSKKKLIAYIHKAMALNDAGVKAPSRTKATAPKKELVVPDDLLARLAQNDAARLAFEKFSTSHKREYVEWIDEARTAPTREKRLATTLEWLAEGKPRNWKYMNC